MYTLGVVCPKGGVGKTSVVVNLAYGLRRDGYRVLCIDCDGQGSLSKQFRANRDALSLYDVLKGTAPITKAAQRTKTGDIVTGNYLLTVDRDIVNLPPVMLRNALSALDRFYDVALIDSSPGINYLTAQICTASNGLLIPAQAEKFSIDGLSELQPQLVLAKQRTNPNLDVWGVLINRFASRDDTQQAALEILRERAQTLSIPVLDVVIRESKPMVGSQMMYQSIFEYSPRCSAAKDFELALKLTKERIGIK